MSPQFRKDGWANYVSSLARLRSVKAASEGLGFRVYPWPQPGQTPLLLVQVLEEVADECMLRYRPPCKLLDYTSEGCSKGSQEMADVVALATRASNMVSLDA